MPFDCCSIMLVGKAFGQFLCQEREVIWEGETLALACERAREPSRIIVTLAARDTLPAGNHRFFDGHCAIEIRDESSVCHGGNQGEVWSPSARHRVKIMLVQGDQRRDLDKRTAPALSDYVTGLGDDNQAHLGRFGQVRAGLGSGSGGIGQPDRRIYSVYKPVLAQNTIALPPVRQCLVDGDDTIGFEISRHPAPSRSGRRGRGQVGDERYFAEPRPVPPAAVVFYRPRMTGRVA